MGTGKLGIGGRPTVGVVVEGTLTVGTPGDGTLTAGRPVGGTLTLGTVTLDPPRLGALTPGTLTVGRPSEGTAIVDGTRGTEMAPATALTEAPSVAPQRTATSALTVVCRRLCSCAGTFSHRALPSDPLTANTSSPEPYRVAVASTLSMRLKKKDAFALRVSVASSTAERVRGDSCSPPFDLRGGLLQSDWQNWTQP
jgi:hypothetical protein